METEIENLVDACRQVGRDLLLHDDFKGNAEVSHD